MSSSSFHRFIYARSEQCDLIGGLTYLTMIKSFSFTWFLSHFFMLLWWIIEENARVVRFWLVLIGPGSQGFELYFCPGRRGIRPSKNCWGGGDDQAWNWLIHYRPITMKFGSVILRLKNSTKKQQNIWWRHDYDVFMTTWCIFGSGWNLVQGVIFKC